MVSLRSDFGCWFLGFGIFGLLILDFWLFEFVCVRLCVCGSCRTAAVPLQASVFFMVVMKGRLSCEIEIFVETRFDMLHAT